MQPLMFEYHGKHWRTGEPYTNVRKASACKVKELLGLDPKKHFPAEGLPEREVQGVRVYVTPVGSGNARRAHRVFAICGCGTHVPAGRMFQHKCKGA